MNQTYTFYDDHPELTISGYVEAQRALSLAPVVSWTTSSGRIWGEVYLDGCDYVIRFCNMCDFRFASTGGPVRCQIVVGGSELDVEHLFHNSVVPLLCSNQGQSIYHASCVTVKDDAIAFLGASGRGKSTLATEFALQGYPFLTDDVLPIAEGMPPTARPHASAVRLWRTTVTALFPPGRKAEAYSTYTSKCRVAADGELRHSTDPARIAAAFVLGDGKSGTIRIRKLDGRTAHAVWLENMFLLDPTDRKIVRRLFERTAEIAGSVPTYALNFPRGFELLPEVRRRILDTVALGEAAC